MARTWACRSPLVLTFDMRGVGRSAADAVTSSQQPSRAPTMPRANRPACDPRDDMVRNIPKTAGPTLSRAGVVHAELTNRYAGGGARWRSPRANYKSWRHWQSSD